VLRGKGEKREKEEVALRVKRVKREKE